MRERINNTRLNSVKIMRFIIKFSLCVIKKHSRDKRIKYKIKITISGKPKIAVKEAFPAFVAIEDNKVNKKEKATAPNKITTKNNGKF